MTLVYAGTINPWNGEPINNVRHPKSIEALWSAEELAAIGLEKAPVEEPGIDALKVMLKQHVDNQAEAVRMRHMTPGDGMVTTYREKLEQAEEVAAQGQPAIDALTPEQQQSTYPTLAASVGIEAKTLWQCSQLVLAKYSEWGELSYAIEKKRLAGKKSINEATTTDEVNAAYQAIDWTGFLDV